MAEFVMKNLVKKAGLEQEFHIESAATSREEIGNPVYPPARQKLAQIRPRNLGQASRVSGVSPADVAVLMVYLGK